MNRNRDLRSHLYKSTTGNNIAARGEEVRCNSKCAKRPTKHCRHHKACGVPAQWPCHRGATREKSLAEPIPTCTSKAECRIHVLLLVPVQHQQPGSQDQCSACLLVCLFATARACNSDSYSKVHFYSAELVRSLLRCNANISAPNFNVCGPWTRIAKRAPGAPQFAAPPSSVGLAS